MPSGKLPEYDREKIMDIPYGVKVNEMVDINARYTICHSLERNGICVFEEEGGLFSRYLSGPFTTKQEAENYIETLEAIDNG